MFKQREYSNQHLKYNIYFSAVISCFLSITGLLNLFIDPYGIFNMTKLAGVNFFKPKQDSYQRIIKSTDIIRQEPKIVLMGSSTVLEGLNPQNKIFENSKDVYNLGITSVNMQELELFFDHLVANNSELKEIVLGLNFFMFNEYKNNQNFIDDNQLLGETRLPLSYLSSILLSADTLQETISTFISNQKNQPKPTHFYQLGMRIPYDKQETLSHKEKFSKIIVQYLNAPYFYQRYKLSSQSLQSLQNIVNKCYQNNIELTVFISPLHASHLEAIAVSDLWSTFEQWKLEISKITKVWDFANYSRFTTETINNEMQYFSDSIHYSPLLGDLILETMLISPSKENSDKSWGTLVDETNIGANLESINLERQKWLMANTETRNWISELKKSK